MLLHFRFIILLLFVAHTNHLFAQFTPRSQSGTSGSKRTYNRYDLDKYISGKEKTPEDSIKEILMGRDSLQLFKDRILITPEELQKLGVSDDVIKQLQGLNGMQDSLDVVKQKRQSSLDEAFRKKYGLPVPKDSLNLEDLQQLIEFQKRQLLEKALSLPVPTVYGQAFFRNSLLKINELSPEIDHRAPDNYTLSTGDEITVTIWGMIDYNQSFTINKDGYIKPALVGLISLKGMTYAQARDLIKQRFAKIYDIKKSEIAISLSFVRLISVNLVGELISPGTYRFPAFTSAYNALVAISGPNNLGSLRNIYIKRNGQTIITLDLYEYLMNPDSKQDFFLENNDYIVVPTQGKIVNINGQSKRADNYELKENEGLNELLKYSGGLKGDALRAALHIKRYQNDKAIVIDVDVDKIKGTNFALQEGDTIFVAQIPNTLLNHVQLVGAARIPGYYEIKSGDRISDILQKAQGITEHADATRAFIERLRPEDKAKQLIPFNVDEVLKNPASPNNFMLQNLDTIRIMSAISAFDGTTIKVSGAVREEGEYPFALGMTLADVLYSAGGMKLEAANNRIEVLRVITFTDENTGQKSQNTTVVKRADVSDQLLVDNAAAQFKLQPYDHVYVRKSALFQDELMVKIYGEVEYPGEYSLINRDETLTQLIDRAGGLSGYAFQTGAKLYRWEDSTGYVLMDISKAMQKAELPHKKRKRQEALLQQLNYNYILLAGDSIFIPKVRNMVTLTGAMRHFEVDTSLHQVSVPFEPNKTAKDYVINYGAGYGRYAKKSRTYVKKANGEIKQTRHFLFFKKYPKVENGSTVFVDESDRHKRKKEQDELLKEYYAYHPKERPTANDTFENIASKVTTLLTLLILIRQVSQ